MCQCSWIIVIFARPPRVREPSRFADGPEPARHARRISNALRRRLLVSRTELAPNAPLAIRPLVSIRIRLFATQVRMSVSAVSPMMIATGATRSSVIPLPNNAGSAIRTRTAHHRLPPVNPADCVASVRRAISRNASLLCRYANPHQERASTVSKTRIARKTTPIATRKPIIAVNV